MESHGKLSLTAAEQADALHTVLFLTKSRSDEKAFLEANR